MSSSRRTKDLTGLLLSGGLVLLFGKFIALPLNMVIRALIVNYLTATEYGLLSLGLTVANVLSVITILGMGQGITRYLPCESMKDNQEAVFASAAQIALPFSIGTAVFIFIFSNSFATILGQPESDGVLRIFSVTIPIMAMASLVMSGIQGLQDANWNVLIQNIFKPLSQLSAIGAGIIVGVETIGMATTYLIGNLVITIIGSIVLFSNIGIPNPFQSYSFRRELVSFSVPLAASGILFMFLGTVDTLLLARLSTADAVGIYNVAYPIASTLTIGLSAFGFISFPVMSEFDSRDNIETMRRSYSNLSKWIFSLTLPVWLIIITHRTILIGTFFGSEYEAGTTALVILSLGFVTHAIMGPNGDTLSSTGRSTLVMVDMMVAFVMNIILNLLLIPRFSFTGAATATTASYIVMNLLIMYHLYTLTGVRPFIRPIIQLIGIGVPSFGISLTISSLLPIEGIAKVVLHTILMGILYLILYLVVMIGPEEEEFLEDIQSKIGYTVPIIHRLI